MTEWVLAATDEEIDTALERARKLDLFILKLSDGRRLVLPRENLQALVGSTPEQAANLSIGSHGTDIWWPDIDEGHYLPNLLEGRTGNEKWMQRLQQHKVAA